MPFQGVIIDHHVGFRFKVEIDGLLMATFNECSGLSGSIEPYDIKEGGMNSSVHRFVNRATYGDITLKRGFINIPELFYWMQDATLNSWSPRKNGSIVLFDDDNNEAARWYFWRALPVKWEAPSLNASQNSIAIESLTLAVEWVSIAPPEPPPPPEEKKKEEPPAECVANFEWDEEEHMIKSNPALDAFIASAKDKDTPIHVHAHTDNTGKASYNKTLSKARADDIATYLINGGIAASRISKFGHGEEELLPCCAGGPDKKCESCRRAEVKESCTCGA
ncbi:MAG: phage tail protein [Bradymonadales bacterium]|nr:phage tail protein [Bradymonadales bacterium]